MSTILITGGSGLIGTALTKMLVAKGHHVIILSRTARASNQQNISYAVWDVKAQTIDERAIASADYIVHLAGASVVEKRWTNERKKEIQDSRTKSSLLLINALKKSPNSIKAIISSSATGWYGDDKARQKGKKMFTEELPPEKDFLGETCRLWEESIEPVKQLGKRLVKFRIGIVLSNEGGAFPEFKKPVKFGVAAVLASGKQIVSWVHIEDVCRMFMYAIEHEELEGVFNAVAPSPVTNKELTLLIAQKLKGKFFVDLHVPAFALKIALGEVSVEVLKSVYASSEKIRNAGFTFLYPSIESALHNLIGTNQ